MLRTKSFTNEHLVSRPQRNMKAKVVFDPSDNYLSKKQKKLDAEKKEDVNISKKPVSPEYKLEYPKRSSWSFKKSNNSSKNILHLSKPPEDSLATPETFEEEVLCFMCIETVLDQQLIHCPFCLKKVHKRCLIIGEPIWKIKLNVCPWFCDKCRENHCSTCLDVETMQDKLYHCLMCNVGLHRMCYEEYKDKPFHELRINKFLCKPCLILGTEVQTEEEDDFYRSNSSEHISNIKSEDEDDNFNSPKFYGSFNISQNDQKSLAISDITKWNKYQIFNYLSGRGLPLEVTEKIIKYEIDGRAVQLLNREDITLSMELKLGLALKFYKEVRLLQTQSLSYSTIWE